MRVLAWLLGAAVTGTALLVAFAFGTRHFTLLDSFLSGVFTVMVLAWGLEATRETP